MDFLKLTEIVASETKAEDFLRERGVLSLIETCPRCETEGMHKTHRSTYLCKSCGLEPGVRSGSVLANSGLPFGTFLMMAMLFDMEIPASRCARELGVNRNTTAKYYRIFCEAVACEVGQIAGDIEVEERDTGGHSKDKRGRGKVGKVPVFGIIERKRKVSVEVVDDDTASVIFERRVKTVRKGNLIYTDKVGSYDTLAMYGRRDERISHIKRFSRGKVFIDGKKNFWSYCKERLMTCHGVSARHFPLYLAELEARYNNRDKDIIDVLMSGLAKKRSTGVV